MKSVEDIGQTLSTLQVGDRLWFWFCPTATPPLLLSPFRDKGVDQLLATVKNLSVDLAAVACTGIARVADSGQICFGAPLLSGEMLGSLAAWVKAHLADAPELARLCDAELVTLTSSGAVVARHADPTLWTDIPRPLVPGGLQECAHRLARMEPGAVYWFWSAVRGPGDQPFLWIHPIAEDPDGTRFSARVVALRQQSPDQPSGRRGTVRYTEAGGLTFTTPQPLPALVEALEALQAGALSQSDRLSGARLLRVGKAGIAALQRLSTVADLSAQDNLLSSLDDSTVLFFWLSLEGSSGRPLLLLAASREALKEQARAAGGGQAVRGRMRLSRKGFLQLQTRDDPAGVLPALASWVAENQQRCPAARRLIDARLTHRTDTGDTRIKDDDAWSALHTRS